MPQFTIVMVVVKADFLKYNIRMEKTKLLSIPELAAAAGLTRVWVWTLVQRGVVPAYKVGNRYVCPPEAVQAVKARPKRWANKKAK